MIISDYFDGDNNKLLKDIQHDVYGEVLYMQFEYPRQRYLRSARLLGVRTELASRLTEISMFDHRVLQHAHDIIAAYFRYTRRDGGQLPLPFRGVDPQRELKRDWLEFYRREVESLAQEDEILYATVTAVAFQNLEKGYQAESQLHTLLKQRYGTAFSQAFERGWGSLGKPTGG